MNLKLQLLCDAPEAVALVQRYWAVDAAGQYREKVSDLLPFRAFTRPAQITQYVREQCRVFDLNQACPRCGEPVRITSRSAARPSPQRSSRPCERCAGKIEQAMREARAQAEKTLADSLQAYMKARPSGTVDYAAVTDDIALLLIALHEALEPAMAQGTFGSAECRALAPKHVGHFIRRLYQAGVLLEEPSQAQRGTYFLKDGQLRVKDSQRVYALMPGIPPGQLRAVLAAYHQRSFNDAPRLFDLWLDYAEADCMAYFEAQCILYAHQLYDDEHAEVRSALRGGLEHYCVAQMWSAICRVVRDAASLANRTYYDRAKASATLPGKLRRYLERARREAFELKGCTRPEVQPPGALGMVFQDLFGIDENTTGTMVWATFAHRSEEWMATGEPTSWMAARRLMVRALQSDMPFATLERFAQTLKAGVALEAAIDEVLARLPAAGA
ncbi:hypothetical protein [Pseudomonas typographi]|uniref:Uncharacterized protein n=1 Tax=Pseudomonas typographi TaxID=2715964 RepID=A0ABR7Z582_9PSED|nr:hypothetical protein [Pseudomonas typographi]MBD1553080.1 hypothetical protein [Pseudomonas typographi]MBD1600532.1 hypothetical protein [Pseudomonas typographi]